MSAGKRVAKALRLWPLGLPLALALASPGEAQTTPGGTLWDRFVSPPDEARPMVRWWWFGPSVTEAELDREIGAMKAGGFGGFEVQPTYPLSPDDARAGIRNLPYLSQPFLDALRHVGETARKDRMRMDLTLGSGWPFGGPHIPATQAASELRRLKLTIPAGADHVALPALGAGERPVALYVDGRHVPLAADAAIAPAQTERAAQLFIAGRTGQQVKRAAVGAEGFVLDHASREAVETHLKAVGDRLMTAFQGEQPPYAIFSDSLEAYGSSWTDDLPAEFAKRRGYDLMDHLPALFDEGTDSAAVRFDWAHTLSELVDERYLAPITAWAHAHGTKFRAQVYGFPPPTLSSNSLVDLPEGEGANWRQFTSTRWATSAAHAYGRPVVSSETWTWLHSPSWAATPLDMKVEADRHFLQGINQLVGHGWPYTPPGVREPGWAFYAASALNDHNPWYPAMPAVNLYLQRVSAMMREGAPEADLAVYLPIEDAFADLRPEHASVNEEMGHRLDEAVLAKVLEAGCTFDLIDAQAITAGKLAARTLVLPHLTRIDPEAYRRIAAFARGGGTVIAVDGLPQMAGGLRDREASRAVAKLSADLLRRHVITVVSGSDLSLDLKRRGLAAVQLERPVAALGTVHRRLPDGDLYLVVNTGAEAIATTARFRSSGEGQWWDPVSGQRWSAGTGPVAVRLAPYESRLLVFARGLATAPPRTATLTPIPVDLAGGWTMQTTGSAAAAPAPGTSWTTDPALRHYSGAVRYSHAITLPGAVVPGERVWLDLGEGTPTAASPAARPKADIAAPVREAAIVRVNGQQAGIIWASPWRLDIARWLKPGTNDLEIVVMNGALNAVAAKPRADYRLLTARYGERFTDQDQDKIAPVPSGLLGSVRLLSEKADR
ncbi:glycoside hydrolase [Sphingomonas sp. AP4-R1]|uniref:glycosyl hydrolase n=1 Tax=Sphingomonas sp. AP4-R1 TaxID=2735134 RepID=UPI001493C11A|nr:glycosyl hydrolase [Sphingomonas sp. AP4-R1]QJU59100.1 glycoside hydrolase [Sphingomonas sp. AP4-R1]